MIRVLFPISFLFFVGCSSSSINKKSSKQFGEFFFKYENGTSVGTIISQIDSTKKFASIYSPIGSSLMDISYNSDSIEIGIGDNISTYFADSLITGSNSFLLLPVTYSSLLYIISGRLPKFIADAVLVNNYQESRSITTGVGVIEVNAKKGKIKKLFFKGIYRIEFSSPSNKGYFKRVILSQGEKIVVKVNYE